MATTIQSGRSNSPKLTADVASRAEIFGGRGLVFDGVTDYLDCGDGLGNLLGTTTTLTLSVWVKNNNSSQDAGIFKIGDGNAGNFSLSYANNKYYLNLDTNDSSPSAYAGFTNTDTSSWHHIVAIYNGTNAIAIYFDGSAQSPSGSGTPPSSIGFTGLNTLIGKYYSSEWNGSISDLKVYSSALTEAEIQSQYLKPESVPSPSTLVAWYPMSEGLAQSIAYDHSGNNNHAVEGGGSSYTLAVAQNEPTIPQIPLVKYNEKMLFDGVNDKITGIGNCPTGDFTISAWILLKNGVSWYAIYSASLEIWFGVGDSEQLRVHIGSNLAYADTGNSVLTLGKIHHVVVTWNGSSAQFYIDGVATTTTASGSLINAVSTVAQIGANQTSNYYDGLIDDVSVFNTAFNSTQAQELFNDGVALDATTHSKSGNLLGYWRNDGVTTWKDRRGWSYLDFDSTDYIDCGTAIGNSLGDSYANDLTVSAWIKLGSISSPFGIFEIGDFSGSHGKINLSVTNTGDLAFRLNGAGWNAVKSFSDLGWSHVVAVYDASSASDTKLYLNGVDLGTGSGSFPSSLDLNSKKTIIGAILSTSYNWEGDIKSVGLYNVAKSEAEIQAIYNAGINSSEVSNSGIINYWELDNASTVKDLVGSSNGTPSGTLVLNDGNTGTVAGSPNSITIREGLTSGKDGLGFPLKNPSGNVLRLNGVNEYLSIPPSDMSLSSQMTIEFWAKHNTGDSSGEQIVDQYDYANNQRSFRVIIDSSEKIQLDTNDNGNSNYNRYLSNSAISNIDNWRHYAVTFSSGTVVMYVDKEVQANTQTQTSGGTSIFNNTTDDLRIGSAWTGTDTGTNIWNGLLDEVRIYNRALSATEVSKNYKHGKGKHKND